MELIDHPVAGAYAGLMLSILSKCFLGLCLLVATQPSLAEPLPGADDPALRVAALAWLNEENPEAALWALGELAADGNVAARVLVNQIYRSERPAMSRDEFLQLVPADRTGASRWFSPYRVDHDAYPALRALNQIANSETADEWIAHAEVIIAAEMQSRLTPFVEGAVVNQPHLGIEVAEFAAEYLRDDPYAWTIVMWFFAFSHMTAEQLAEMQTTEAARQWQARWTEDPWPQTREDAFTQELLTHSWDALHVEGMMRRLASAPELTARFVDPTLLDDETLRLADLVSAGPYGPDRAPDPPTAVELHRLGQIHRQYAARFPSAVPTITLCERHCPSRAAECIGSVGLLGDIGFVSEPNYTPVLTPREYYSSERAVRARLDLLGHIEFPGVLYPDWMVLPQCMVDALPARAD